MSGNSFKEPCQKGWEQISTFQQHQASCDINVIRKGSSAVTVDICLIGSRVTVVQATALHTNH
jgi:hypothetical protein